jgi:hypothetical protein
MSVSVSTTNKPLNPRAQDLSPKGYNRAALYSGKALDFDGVNDLITGQIGGSLISGAHSFFAYVYADADYGDGTYNYVFSSGSGQSGQQISLGLKGTSAGNVLFSSAYSTPIVESSYLIESQKYISVGYSYDGTDLTFYLNGQALDTQTIALAPTSSNYRFGQNMGTGTFFDGKISNAKVFNTALTAAQVSDLYLNPEKIVPDGVADSALKLWLPMMEGAGTTAYDGSGNGNHGTISGATWVSGIGAPVAQTALVSWNKATNLLLQSNTFDTTWGAVRSSVTSGHAGYDGTNDAWLFESTTTANSASITQTNTTSGVQNFSVYAKAGTSDWIRLFGSGSPTYQVYFDLSTGAVGYSANIIAASITPVVGGWYRCSVSANATLSNAVLSIANGDNDPITNSGDNIYIQDAQLESTSEVGAYVETFATAQTSPVLLPQGLTANKDITGVNAFESARNPYALNFDGASWGEVHDNASLDFGTGSFSLEIWSKSKYITSGSIYNVLLTLGDNVSSGSTSSLYIDSSLNYTFRYDSTLIVAGGSSEGDWAHIVGVYDGTNINIYLNGSFVVQTAASATSKTNTYSKRIGTDTAGASRTYKDQLALPRIYNRALTATEVARNYNADKSKFGL